MTRRILIAGAGGQGVMLLGKVLAEGAMREGRHVSWFPAYGAEVRGGTAHCTVIISDEEIASPCINKADVLIAMNGPSLTKFKSRVKTGGMFIINSSLAQMSGIGKNHSNHPFSDIAFKLGNVKVANMAALGCYLACDKIVGLDTVLQIVEDIAPKDKKNLVSINQAALRKGFSLNDQS